MSKPTCDHFKPVEVPEIPPGSAIVESRRTPWEKYVCPDCGEVLYRSVLTYRLQGTPGHCLTLTMEND